ncbi:MAG: phage minor capsid protein [Huintestinicola sp.]
MLTPDYLQGAPAELENLFLKLEEEIISDICRRIAKVGGLTDSAEHEIIRLKELGAGTDYIKQKIAEYSGLSDEAVDSLFFDAAQTSDEFYSDVYDKANVPYTPYEYNEFFQQAVTAAVNQTKGELRNFTQSMGFSYRGSNGQIRFHTAAEAYRDCLDYVFMQTATGMTDYNTAVRNATKRLTDSGLQFVDYESGVRNHADVAARRAVLTGLSQYTGKIAERNMQELDTDIVEVDAHPGARPDHAEWQGRWYSFSGKSEKYPSLVEVTGYGTVTGLKGANCRHDYYPVIEGISEPSYTEEELRNIDPPPFEYDGKTYTCYEATQRQRYMERAIRKTKRELLAADSTCDKDKFTEKSVLLRRQKEEYNKFSKAAGLLTQNERTQVAGFGRSEASRASWAAKKVQTASGGAVPASGSTPTSTKGSSSSNSPTNAPRIFKTKSELEKMSLAQLREETKALAKEYYSSGKSGISFGSADIEKVAEKLANGASKNALIKDYMSLKKRVSGLDKSGESGIIISEKQFGKKIGKHAEDYGLDASKEEDRQKMKEIINDIHDNRTEIRTGQFCGQSGDVDFFIKGDDVVICKPNNEFITIMKDGVNNDWVKNARKR